MIRLAFQFEENVTITGRFHSALIYLPAPCRPPRQRSSLCIECGELEPIDDVVSLFKVGLNVL